MSTLAIDIGSYAIKAIQGRSGRNPVIEKTAQVFNKTGLIVVHDSTQEELLTQILGNLITDNKLNLHDVRLSLPESLVSTKIISMPVLTDAELASAITWQAEQHIPIAKEDLSLEYQVIYRPEKKTTGESMKVLLVGSRKSVVEKFVGVMLILGVEPTVVETQTISIARNLDIGKEEPATLVLNFGAMTLHMFVISWGELVFTTSLQLGSNLLTKTIQQVVGLDIDQAEEYKRSYGLRADVFDGKVRQALIPLVEHIVNEVRKSINFFQVQTQQQQQIKRLVLVGGGAQLNGFVEYLAQTFGIEVLLGAPFTTSKGKIPESDHQAWSVAMGMLMRLD